VDENDGFHQYRKSNACERAPQMSTTQRFVIVGAGLAGASAAQTLRAEWVTGSITLIGHEQHPPYNRPPLSKQRLVGGDYELLVKPADWYAENGVELRLGTVVRSIDAKAHTVSLKDGETVAYDQLLLATGATPRRTTIPGATLPGVHYLRTIEDSDALRDKLKGGRKKLVVLGSGWIAMEVAASARMLGNDVTLLEVGHGSLHTSLGSEVDQIFGELHTQHGVDLRNHVEVLELVEVKGSVGAVRVKDAADIPCDLVLVAIGASPNTFIAEEAGLDVDGGILVDEALRTSDPNIFAAGDAANAFHPVLQARLRSDHWSNALTQGPAAARSMLGQTVVYDEVPYFYTDQYDLGMEFAGYVPLTKQAKVVFRGDPKGRNGIVFWLHKDRVVGGMNINVWDVNDEIKRIIRGAQPVDTAKLSDPSVDLATL
jgi:3-phenylpropionate/trans-cinnamate dioxygenase ferredoxin reductase subunit